jgi:hypothetical protein
VVDRVSVDTLDGILTPLLQYVQERTNTADEDAWTGEAAVEYVCANLSEQVSFAPAMTGKLKADTPQDCKPQKSSAGAPVTCTVCKKNKTTNSSKVCLACAQAKKAAGAPAAAVATGDDGRERQCQCPRPQHPGFAGVADVSEEGGEYFRREWHGTLQQRTPPRQTSGQSSLRR